jgi:hypothetical protein
VIDPDVMAAPATRLYIDSLRVKAPSIAALSDGEIVELGYQIAERAYRGDGAAVWTYGDSLGLSRYEYGQAVYATLHDLFPVAIRVAPGEADATL